MGPEPEGDAEPVPGELPSRYGNNTVVEIADVIRRLRVRILTARYRRCARLGVLLWSDVVLSIPKKLKSCSARRTTSWAFDLGSVAGQMTTSRISSSRGHSVRVE